jgi:hypothetical protein
MNAIPTFDRRYMTILIVVLIVVLLVLALNVLVWFSLMSGGMMGWGSMTLAPGASAGVNGVMMNDMMNACTNMMQNFQNP